MKKILVIVDMQNDFIDGPLGTPEARAIVDNVCAKIRGGEWAAIRFTADTHNDAYLCTQEGKYLPIVHCIEDTYGWQINDKVYKAIQDAISLNNIYDWDGWNKHTFTSHSLVNWLLKNYNDVSESEYECTIIGVCTDICVISNALAIKSVYPEMKIVVDASCCAGSTPDKHRMALEVMKSCQCDVINDDGADDYIMVADVSEKFKRVNPITPTEVRTVLFDMKMEELTDEC